MRACVKKCVRGVCVSSATLLCEVDGEAGVLGGPLLAAKQDQALTQGAGGVGVLGRGQVEQQHGPQHLQHAHTHTHRSEIRHQYRGQ